MTAPLNPRLVRADVVAHPHGGVVLTTPRGTALRVHLDHAELMRLLTACDGRTPVDDLVSGHPQPALLRELLDRLSSEGCLSDVDNDPHWVRFPAPAADPHRVVRSSLTVLGTGVLARRALEIAEGFGGRWRRVLAGGPPSDVVRLAGKRDSVAAVLLDRFDHATLAEVDQACAKAGITWSYFCFDTRRGRFGPHMRPGSGPSYADLHARRLAAAPDPAAVRALERSDGTRDAYLPPGTEIAWMLSAFLVDLERWLAGAPALGLWHEVEVDPVELAVDRHPVLPMPDSALIERPAHLPADPAALLTDARLGIVTGLRTVPGRASYPASLVNVQATGCDISRVGPWNNDPVGGGTSFAGPARAREAATGELVERYCGNIVRPGLLRRAPYDELAAEGEHAVDPRSLVLHSPTQYATPGFPFVPMRPDLPIHWVRGHNLTRDVPAWLPASLVYVNWHKTPWGAEDPPTNGTYFAGIAAGPDRQRAILGGLQEVVERHATMVWWLNRHPLPAVDPGTALRAMWPQALRPHAIRPLRAWLIQLDNEFGAPVMAGVVEDPAAEILTIGFACRPDPPDAALKAWAEALVLQEISQDLLRERGAYQATIAGGRLPDQGLKPWRDDRLYLDSYRPDFRDVTSLLCQSQVYLDPRAVARVRPWVDVPVGRKLDDLPRTADLRKAVERMGYEVYYADITTPDVAVAGLTVVRTLVPGLVGNFPAAFPLLGRDAIGEAAVRLGWRPTPLPEAELNPMPVPHA